MILSLIGMSGSGKTHWSRKLAEAGYQRIGCDDRIEQRLIGDGNLNGPGGIRSVANWLGQPHDPGFAQREAAYLAAERAVANEILESIDHAPQAGHAIDLAIDTTGSVVYLGEKICRRLQALTTIVYLETSLAELEMMFRQYRSDPKPVVWNGEFRQTDRESEEQALERCYRDLLLSRRALYQRYASVTLSAARLRQAPPDAAEFLRLIRHQLVNRS